MAVRSGPRRSPAPSTTSRSSYNETYDAPILDGKAKLSDADGPFVAALTAYDKLRKAGCFNSDAHTPG